MLPKFLGDTIATIKGPYTLLAFAILVVEGFFGRLIVLAETPDERILYSIPLTLVFLAFLYVVKVISKPAERVEPYGLGGEVTPAHEEVTEEEIGSPERIAGPDRSYSINKPPKGWTIRELSWDEWIRAMSQIPHETQIPGTLEGPPQKQEILALESGRETLVTPIPGKTLLDGRPFPTALSIPVPTQLAILPMDRAQPPLFVERPFAHNLMSVVGGLLSLGVITLHQLSEATTEGGRSLLIGEFRQLLENAVVNGKEDESISINWIAIGIQGELRDHLLMLNYPSLREAKDPDVEQEVDTLRSLVSSFRPLRAVRSEEKRQEYEASADQQFKELLATKGKELFAAEFEVLLRRLEGLDLENPQERNRAIQFIKPFEQFANQIDLQDEDLDSLWESIPEAEAGNASQFKEQLGQLSRAGPAEVEKVGGGPARVPPDEND